MKRLVLLLIACGSPLPVYESITARLPSAPAMDLLRFSVDAGGLPDGGSFWLAGDGQAQSVLEGTAVDWIVVERLTGGGLGANGSPGCHDSFVVGDAGVTVTVQIGADSCTHEYE